MEKVCIIAGAAAIEDEDFLQYYNNLIQNKRDVLVIAADKGYAFLCSHGIKADLVVGDFDSLGAIPEGENVITHPVMKDDTDMLLAMKEGLKRECTFFAVFGGLGGRPDHSFANIQSLAYLREHGARGVLFGETMHMTTIWNEGMCFDAGFCGMLSIFVLGEKAEGVNLKQLKYELEDACLSSHMPLGISNEFIGKSSEIQVRQGELLVMWDKNQGQLPEFQY